jgi:tetratricopeptide (TPR) repeat protein
MQPEIGVVPNIRYTFIYGDSTTPPTGFHRSADPVAEWLDTGTCLPRDNLAVMLFDWSHLRESADHYAPLVEAKCPGVPVARLNHSVVYRLDATIPSYAQGLAYAEAGEWRAAIAIYDEALTYNPHSARAYADRARAYLALGDLPQALADFDAALAQMPEWDALHAERVQAMEVWERQRGAMR